MEVANGLRLVPKSMTLNDLERRNGGFWHNLSEFWEPTTSKWLRLDRYCLEQVAQLSQRDRAAGTGWVSNVQKWKTGIGR